MILEFDQKKPLVPPAGFACCQQSVFMIFWESDLLIGNESSTELVPGAPKIMKTKFFITKKLVFRRLTAKVFDG